VKVDGLGEYLRRRGFVAHAMTEHGNVNGIYKFVKDLKFAGIKPILGCEFYIVADRFARGITEEEKEQLGELWKPKKLGKRELTKKFREYEKFKQVRKNHHVVVLAKNNQGWRKIVRAVEVAHEEGFYYKPRIDYEILKSLAPDCIILTACLGGVPSFHILQDQRIKAFEWCKEMVDCFGDDFYIEIQPNEIPIQRGVNEGLIRISEQVGCNIVATNDVHYLDPSGQKTHDVLLALRDSQRGRTVLVSDPDRFRYETTELDLKTRQQMERAFEKFHGDLDSQDVKNALDNTLRINAKIEPEILEYRKGVLPDIKLAKRYNGNLNEALWDLVRDGWKWRNIKQRCKKDETLKNVYIDRVKFEMDEITRLGFSGYFLVIFELIQWARSQGIRVGPGRGSVGGSIVAYLLGITALDSVKYNCPFSRFITEDRIDYPDIDIDFPTNERDKIKQHLIDKYGQDKVAGISTFGRMKGRMVLKDIGRVHAVPWQETEQITKLVPQRPDGDERAHCCVEDTFSDYPAETADFISKYKHVVDYAGNLEGNVRHLGVHAAGMVVSDEPLRNLVPVQYTRDSGKVGQYLTSWDKKDVEAVGLLKLDILGIEGLTYIQRCLDLIQQIEGKTIEPENWTELADKKVYENFCEGNTQLVWQMSAFNTVRILRQLQPDKFEHLVATTSLIRPGPQNAGITDEYIKRRHGKKTKGIHPLLDDLLSSSYGLFVFQEDVIKTVHEIGGFTLAEADRIRKDIGKKKGVEYLKKTYLDRFVEGASLHEIEPKDAEKIWNMISEFGAYSFNRAHATGYSILSYWTMFLKIHYPSEFMAAALEVESDSEKRRTYIKEARRLGITVTGPDINISGLSMALDTTEQNTIRAGLIDVKGIGKVTARKIISGQPYGNLRDYAERSNAGKTATVALARVGALDSLHENGKEIAVNADEILKVAKLKGKDKYWDSLQLDEIDPYTIQETEIAQLELISLPPKNHVANDFTSKIRKKYRNIQISKIGDFENIFTEKYSSLCTSFVGLIVKSKTYTDENDSSKHTVKLTIEDDSGTIELRVTNATETVREITELKTGQVVFVTGRASGLWRLDVAALIRSDELTRVSKLKKFNWLKGFHPKHVEFLDNRESLKRFVAKPKKFRTCVIVVNSEPFLTRNKKNMLRAMVLDWTGQFRSVTLWPSDFAKQSPKFLTNERLLLRIENKSRDGIDPQYFIDSRSGGSPVMEFEKYYRHNVSN
jgi:DNA polymerase-3 subunit alpha